LFRPRSHSGVLRSDLKRLEFNALGVNQVSMRVQ
jgi:hypothetical protein